MTDEQKAAFINAQSACAMATIQGMTAENMQRAAVGSSMAYDEAAFLAVIKEYGINRNTVMMFFQGE